MATRIDQNGIPAVVEDESTTTGQAIGAAVVVPPIPSATYGSLVTDLLTEFDDAATIVIDPNSRAIYAASGAAGTGLRTAISGAAENEASIIPGVGQTGKSLAWEEVSGLDDLPPSFKAAVDTQITATKPLRTVQSLISNMLADTGLLSADPKPVIAVDQTGGKVWIFEMTTGAEAETVLDALANAGDRVKITLSEPEVPGSPSMPIFEGGSTD
jgi:hypothetical protein